MVWIADVLTVVRGAAAAVSLAVTQEARSAAPIRHRPQGAVAGRAGRTGTPSQEPPPSR